MFDTHVESILGTLATNRIGRNLIDLNYEKERHEANFRYGLARLRENVESVALYRGEHHERTSLTTLFSALTSNFREIMRCSFCLNGFSHVFTHVSNVLPYLIASPRYFAKEITLGDLTQIVSSFLHIQMSLSFVMASYTTIAQWRAATRRLIDLANTLKDLHAAKQNSKIKIIRTSKEQNIRIEGLTAQLPSNIATDFQPVLIENFNWIFEPYQSVLITGKKITGIVVFDEMNLSSEAKLPIRIERIFLIDLFLASMSSGQSGCGKSTLLRILSGIWPYGRGTITMPLHHKVEFIPQKPYCPLGSLRHCLAYPLTQLCPSVNDTDIGRLLHLCKLESLADHLDDIKDWSLVLSSGEQQKMAFVRVLLHRPEWIFLDEVTSSLDELSETHLYSTLFRELGSFSTIISVGHRRNLRQFHRIQLQCINGQITRVNAIMQTL